MESEGTLEGEGVAVGEEAFCSRGWDRKDPASFILFVIILSFHSLGPLPTNGWVQGSLFTPGSHFPRALPCSLPGSLLILCQEGLSSLWGDEEQLSPV